MNNWLGIDYGSKLAGTTCVVWQDDKHVLTCKQSEKKQDADKFIKEIVEERNPDAIFIDAPLSLPGAYFSNGSDFFYREADRKTNAMSPMFIGGLTARAMKLKNELNFISFYEAYPGGLARLWDLQNFNYKIKSAPADDFVKKLSKRLKLKFQNPYLKTGIE